MPPSRSEVTDAQNLCRRLLEAIKRLRRIEKDRDRWKARAAALEAEMERLQQPTRVGEES